MTVSDENYVAGLIDCGWCEDGSSTGVATPQTSQVDNIYCYLKENICVNYKNI